MSKPGKLTAMIKSPHRKDQLWRILDDQTANRVAQAHGLPESGGESFIGKL